MLGSFRKSSLSFVSFVSVLITIISFAPNAQAVRVGVDLDKQCKKQYGSNSRVELRGNTVNDWKCKVVRTRDTTSYESVSVNSACRNQHGVQQASYSNFNDPGSWYCASNIRVGVDLDKQCKEQYGSNSRVELRGDTVNDWKCKVVRTRRTTSYESVSVNSACRNQHGVQQASYSNFNDPGSWYCEVP